MLPECTRADAAQTACFSGYGMADPGLLPRVVGLWAKRGLTPTCWHSAVCGRDDSKLYIDIKLSGLNSELATQTAGELSQIWDVPRVLMSLDRDRASA
jgi:acetolactate synthase small subunit